jgi:hypothetical protein
MRRELKGKASDLGRDQQVKTLAEGEANTKLH